MKSEEQKWESKLQQLMHAQSIPPPSPGFTERIINRAIQEPQSQSIPLKNLLGLWLRPKVAIALALVLILGLSLGLFQVQPEIAEITNTNNETSDFQLAAFSYEEDNPWIMEE